jgi:hypothetical protein
MESIRRVLRESYLYAEAATQLWFNDFPEATYRDHLKEAQKLVEAALAAGYRDARLIVDLAFVAAILDGPPSGLVILRDIHNGTDLDWNAVARTAAEIDAVDLASQGFALGMDQSAVWTRLGTFASRFLDNEQLAEALYRAAVRLNPQDAIALTNLARHLTRKEDSTSLQEAERLLLKAQNFADRRFVWWRHVLATVRERKGVAVRQPDKIPDRLPGKVANLDEIRKAFHVLEVMPDVQKRGFELERLVFQLSKLTFGTSAPAYKIERDGGTGVIRQIDGFFYHRLDRYRVECKWLSEPAGQNDITIFSDKLEVAGISGLFISMSGFKDTAISKAKELKGTKPVLLMDGEEAAAVFNGHILFDEVIARKREGFDRLSQPYYRILPRT